MGRRKQPQTKEELLAEKEYAEKKIEQCRHQEQLYKNAYTREERNIRTRRLCKEAGILEHYVPELQMMDKQTAGEFIQVIACSETAQEFLRKRGLRSNAEEPAPDIGK